MTSSTDGMGYSEIALLSSSLAALGSGTILVGTVNKGSVVVVAVSVLWAEASDVKDENVIDTTKMKKEKMKDKVSRFMRKTLLYF